MRNVWLVAVLLAAVTLAGCASTPSKTTDSDGDGYEDAEEIEFGSDPRDPASVPAVSKVRGYDDAVVIAVIDSGFNPYHWDMSAEHMPQAQNADASDDLPLYDDPSTWLPGHPGAEAFASYSRLNLTLSPFSGVKPTAELRAEDDGEWSKVQTSTGPANEQVHMAWIPGTKVIGAVTFGGAPYAASSHGVGSSSVSVGNYHGSCPNCLLVFVNGLGEAANEWVAQQDWIDAQTNSWGFSTAVRDRMYAGSDTELQKEAVQRGQQIFFSAGNGQDGAFVVPNPTLFSSQEGPDWIITVGAISPSDGSSYSGHGRPADIAAPGGSYPSAGGGTVTSNATFGGTSNATPVTTGMYGQALYELRRAMAGASRTQQDGVVATGDLPCGTANAACATADGEVTIKELRQALFRGAQYTPTGWNAAGVAPIPATENSAELTYLSEGHGSFYGKLHSEEEYRDELERITGYASGAWYEPQDADQLAWFIADSICRQGAWGTWEDGYKNASVAAPAMAPDWPVRNWFIESCPTVVGAVVAAEKIRDGG